MRSKTPQQIYRYHEYAKDPRYSEIYELYVGSYETMNEKLGDKSFFNICKHNFYDIEFDENDIPVGMKRDTEREYLR